MQNENVFIVERRARRPRCPDSRFAVLAAGILRHIAETKVVVRREKPERKTRPTSGPVATDSYGFATVDYDGPLELVED